MPTYYFSEQPEYDSLDAVEMPNATEACRAAVHALKMMAADHDAVGLMHMKLHVWEPNGALIGLVSLTVDITLAESIENPDS